MAIYKDVLRCLPLLSSVLADKLGVKVIVGGNRAYCQGKEIHLPALPDNDDEVLISLVRGYLDHESAHIRFTDMRVVHKANMDAVTKHLWNSIEDWRVENRMAALYPGSRQHFRWLINHFMNQNTAAGASNPAVVILNYVLASVRLWDVPELEPLHGALRWQMEAHYRGLADQLDRILVRVRAHCPSTQTAIDAARELAACIRRWQPPVQSADKQVSQEPHDAGNTNNQLMEANTTNTENQSVHQSDKEKSQQDGNSPTADSANDSSSSHGAKQAGRDRTSGQGTGSTEEIEDLFAMTTDTLPQDMGEQLANELGRHAVTSQETRISIATIGKKDVRPLHEMEIQATMKASSALRHRLQGLLQAETRKRCAIGRQGALDTGKLYRLSVSNPRVFRRDFTSPGLNTAVHLLLDSSGSMFSDINLARQATYAVAKSLESIKGVSVAVTGFPARRPLDAVYPLLAYGERVSNRFGIDSHGSTPLAEALWWVLAQLASRPEARKLVMVITDGQPDNPSATHKAIEQATRMGVETFGIGLGFTQVGAFFSAHCNVSRVEDLPQALFAMLQRALLQGGPRAHAA